MFLTLPGRSTILRRVFRTLRSGRRRAAGLVALAAWLIVTLPLAAQGHAEHGVVVETIGAASTALPAALRPGDVVTGWERSSSSPADRSGAQGVVRSPLDVTAIEIEQAPRGVVTLRGHRGGRPLSVVMPNGPWQLATRPAMRSDVLEHYSEGRRLAAEGKLDAALASWTSAANAAGDERIAAWLWLQMSVALRDGKRLPAAREALQEATVLAKRAGDRAALAAVQEARARLLEAEGEFGEAERAYREAIATRETEAGPGLATAAGLVNIAALASNRAEGLRAEALLREAIALQQEHAPGSFVHARSLARLGSLLRGRGDLAGAEPLLREAVSVFERLSPDTVDLADSLTNLGNLLTARGTLQEASAELERALAIYERVDPSGRGIATSLGGIGLVRYFQGRLAEAEPYYRRALARVSPGTMEQARSLNNLAILLAARGDVSGAEHAYHQSLAVKEKLAPGTLTVASTLHNIGALYKRRGDAARAEDYYTRALALTERVAPDSLDLAITVGNLGNLAKGRGDLAAAEALHQRALEIKQRQAPGSLTVAQTLVGLAQISALRGDLTAARERYEAARLLLEKAAPRGLEMPRVLLNLAGIATLRHESVEAGRLLGRALAITEEHAPGSMEHADTLRENGLQARRQGDATRAAALLGRAVDVLDSQTRRVGGSDEVRTTFAAQGHEFYADYIDTLLALGQPARAFDVLERSRARGLRMMLAERDLVLDGDLPPDLAREQQRLREDDDRLQAALARLRPGRDDADIARLRSERRDLQERRARIIDRVRTASPRLAALQYSRPLGLESMSQALEAGTVLLSYQIGTSTSRLFVVSRRGEGAPALTVHELTLDAQRLRDQIQAMRRLIERQADPRTEAGGGLHTVARELYDVLLAPAGDALEAADRILIVPDGPLHSLPFAALIRPGGASRERPWQYLTEWKPLHSTLSATVYAELTKTRQASAMSSTLVAFGDPQYPEADGAIETGDGDVSALLRGGNTLEALPATRVEVSGLARTFGEAATVYLGTEATESRAKAVRKARYVHFATHGLLDPRWPLDSAVALTMPGTRREGEENGLLQAWEIFEQVRLETDLVTLSACETALGAELAGEGLIGLTRAFHYAGARSVLASLWRVADGSTAALMATFYGHLRSGLSKDEALRRAQREAIAEPATAAPFHWAAFTLSGDWR